MPAHDTCDIIWQKAWCVESATVALALPRISDSTFMIRPDREKALSRVCLNRGLNIYNPIYNYLSYWSHKRGTLDFRKPQMIVSCLRTLVGVAIPGALASRTSTMSHSMYLSGV